MLVQKNAFFPFLPANFHTNQNMSPTTIMDNHFFKSSKSPKTTHTTFPLEFEIKKMAFSPKIKTSMNK